MNKQLNYFYKSIKAYSLLIATLVTILWVACTSPAQYSDNRIDAGFLNPSDSANTRVCATVKQMGINIK